MSIEIESNKYYFEPSYNNSTGFLSTWQGLLFPVNGKRRYDTSERPPFPIIYSQPNVGQIITNINRGDLFFYVTNMTLITLISAKFLGNLNTMNIKLRWLRTVMVVGNVSVMFSIMNASVMRLTGYMDNGLRWKVKDARFTKKFDLTSEYEKGSRFSIIGNRV